jgi:hypothetical protein
MPCQKTLHDAPPLDALCKNIMREEFMGRHYLFWLRPTGLRHVISWICFFTQQRNRSTKSH